MINLVPKWAYEYEEFWITIRRRNLWLIKIRYLAVLGLFGFLILGQFLLDFNLTSTQVQAITAIAFSIFFYNAIIQVIRPRIGSDPVRFNSMHISLLQILLDLIALFTAIYFTGTVESPLYVFFIFHMIIGSLILPGYLIYSICGFVVFFYTLLVFFQHFGLIDTHLIQGFYSEPPVRIFNHDLVFSLVFATMMILSVQIANRISRNLLRREGELRETLQELRDSEIAKQKYIMGVVHEIKTPLAAALTMIDLINQKYLGPVNEKIEEKLKRIQSRLADSVNLVNNVLRISKLRLLKITSTEELDAEQIICTLYDQIRDNFISKNIDFKFKDDRIQKRIFHGDKVLIELAFSNILNNSVKYSIPNGRVEIKINDQDEMISLQFMDSGMGIPESDIEKVFNQFYRASNVKSGSIEGTGLGLSLVKEIIERHGGSIEIKSPSSIGTSEMPGTEIIVKLPYSAKVKNPLEEKNFNFEQSL